MRGKVTRWWWVRHAPVLDMDGKLYGASDVPCDTKNLKAFKKLAKELPADALWITTHLQRTHQTAEAIREAGLKFSLPIIERLLGEQDFGAWQGLSWSEMEKLNPDLYSSFWENPARNRPPKGESFEDQIQRVANVINRVTHKNSGKTIVAIAHGGTIRAAITHALGLSPETGMSFVTDNLSMTCLEHVEGGLLKGKGELWRIVCINRTT